MQRNLQLMVFKMNQLKHLIMKKTFLILTTAFLSTLFLPSCEKEELEEQEQEQTENTTTNNTNNGTNSNGSQNSASVVGTWQLDHYFINSPAGPIVTYEIDSATGDTLSKMVENFQNYSTTTQLEVEGGDLCWVIPGDTIDYSSGNSLLLKAGEKFLTQYQIVEGRLFVKGVMWLESWRQVPGSTGIVFEDKGSNHYEWSGKMYSLGDGSYINTEVEVLTKIK